MKKILTSISGSNRGYKTSTIIERFITIIWCGASAMSRYGVQEGAKKGYNPSKKGRASHHPLIAFISDVKLTFLPLKFGDYTEKEAMQKIKSKN